MAADFINDIEIPVRPDAVPEIVKPPLGAQPYYIVIPERVCALSEAINDHMRYRMEHSKREDVKLMQAWARELLELLGVYDTMLIYK